jgi:CubicO group peptidase (beta-lactamase class C family)
VFTRTRIKWFALLVLLHAPLQAQDDGQHPRIVDALRLLQVWLEAQRAYDELPGLSAAVVHDQNVLWSGGFGYADLATKTPANANTIYSICSISKLFTSLGIMQLRDAGKLRLDDPVASKLPWFKIKGTNPEWAEVTVEGLLTHSAGLPREADLPYWTGPEFAFPTHDEIVSRISSQEMLYPPATYFQYSNLGITLAGEVIAAVSGEPFENYIKRNVLAPLNLTSTTPDMPDQERGRKLAMGYSSINREGTRTPVTFYKARGISPAAGFASSAADLARFASWHFRLLSKGGHEVVRARTLREMQRVHFIDPDFETTWGLGYSVWRADGKTFVGHGGSCPGFRTQLLLRPEDKIATVFMTNAQGVNTTTYAQSIYNIMAPAIQAAVADSAKKITAKPGLAKFAGTYEMGFSGETAIVQWEDGLAAVNLPTMEPVRGLTRLRQVGENTFRRVRRDGQLGETIVFDMGADGRPTKLVWFSNNYRRVR